jgi:ribbon-helix-helix CopG family protein
MNRTNIYLEEAQSAALEAASRAQGISRAELVRRLISRGMGEAKEADLEIDLAAINESFGVLAGEGTVAPPGEPTDLHTLLPERGPDERARHLDRVGRL